LKVGEDEEGRHEVAMTTLAPLHQEIRVNFRYGVYFTEDVFAPHNPLLAGIMADGGGQFPRKVLAVVDSGLYQHHPRLLKDIADYMGHHSDSLMLTCSPLLVPGGEQAKNETFPVSQVRRAIHANGLCRHSYVVAAGGGAVIDMTGYAAATSHRGVRLIRLPTTVMAQADASIGVKNGINAFGKKNFVGTFAPPSAVINDAHFLTTLSPRDWISGVAEAVKVALIKDAAFFAFLEENAPGLADRRLDLMSQTVHRSAELHLQHISTGGDPFEMGSSRPLDFGHWSAHKLEQLTKFSLRHGEAVAIGMALDVTYSCLAGELSRTACNRVITLLENLGLPIYVAELEEDGLLEGLQEFREHLGGRLTVMLLEKIGQGREVHDIDQDLVRAAAGLLRERVLGHDLLVLARRSTG
jgi:3-dehydroquinate synthase